MIDCIKYDTCAFSQAIYVGRNNPRFPTALNGWLPGLCPCPDLELLRETSVKQTVYTENVTDGMFLKLKAEVHNLKENVDMMRVSKKKQLDRYNDYNL